jgi:hypothetical protein
MGTRLWWVSNVVLGCAAALLAGCGGDAEHATQSSGGRTGGGASTGGIAGPGGGGNATGGAATTGGSPGTGGSGGGQSTGGTQQSGGTSPGGSGNAGSATGGAATGGQSTGGALTGGVLTGGTSPGGSGNAGSAVGGAPIGGLSSGGATSGGTATGGVPTGGQATGGSATGGVATGGQAAGGTPPATGGSATGGVSAGGTATGGAATGGSATGGATTGGQATGGTATGGSATGGVSTGGQPTGGVATGGIATGGSATGGTATGGVATGGVATGGQSTGGAATGGTATGGAGGAAGTPNPDILWQYTGPANSMARGVVVDSGRVVHVAGSLSGAGWHLRLDESGNLVGSDVDPQVAGSSFADLVIDSSDAIYFVGSSGGQAYIRYGGVGGTTWGRTDKRTAGSGSEWEGAVIDSQGRIVTTGRSWGPTYDHVMVRRYLAAGGYDLDILDSSVNEICNAVAVDASDNIYVAARRENMDGTGTVVTGTGELIRWTASGTRSYTVAIPNKSTCVGTGYYTNTYSVVFDPSGKVWLLGSHCDFQTLLRRYEPATGALLLNADYSPPDQSVSDIAFRLASDGVSLAVAGSGALDATSSGGFKLLDMDYTAAPLRQFYEPRFMGGISDVAFIGRDRIVAGSFRNSDNTYSAWVARIRSP